MYNKWLPNVEAIKLLVTNNTSYIVVTLQVYKSDFQMKLIYSAHVVTNVYMPYIIVTPSVQKVASKC